MTSGPTAIPDLDLATLPGGDLVIAGLRALSERRITAESLLLQIASQRLRASGLPVPSADGQAELRLYELLATDDEDSAHARFNALVRRLISFEKALLCASR